jgi:ribonucleoside-diphosphate reductase alpha chain
MQDKQGVQQELLPGSTMASAPVEAVSIVRPAMGEAQQLHLGGMQETLSGACPDCGSQLEFAEGCVKCHVCGYSECG